MCNAEFPSHESKNERLAYWSSLGKSIVNYYDIPTDKPTGERSACIYCLDPTTEAVNRRTVSEHYLCILCISDRQDGFDV